MVGMKRLIINGDDFGYTESVNEGILRAHRASVLTSTTLMPTGRAFEDAVVRAKSAPSLSVGIHLMLVGGHPVSPPETIPSLMGSGGNFLHDLSSFLDRLDE